MQAMRFWMVADGREAAAAQLGSRGRPRRYGGHFEWEEVKVLKSLGGHENTVYALQVVGGVPLVSPLDSSMHVAGDERLRSARIWPLSRLRRMSRKAASCAAARSCGSRLAPPLP